MENVAENDGGWLVKIFLRIHSRLFYHENRNFLRFHSKIYNINISPSRENNCFTFFISALSHMQVGRFEFNERPRRPIFPRFSYPVELRVSAQLCFNCTAIINYSPPRRKYSYRRSRVNKGRITLPRRVAPSLMQF